MEDDTNEEQAMFTQAITPKELDKRHSTDEESQLSNVNVEITTSILRYHAIITYIPTIISVVIGSYCGVTIRILLTELSHIYGNSNSILHRLGDSYFLANVVGCFVMGVARQIKPLISMPYIPLLSGITTGFCGCCTTFSSWNIRVAYMISYNQWEDAIFVLGLQLIAAITSYRMGIQVADIIISPQSVDDGATQLYESVLTQFSVLQSNLKVSLETFQSIHSTRVDDHLLTQLQESIDTLLQIYSTCVKAVMDNQRKKSSASEQKYAISRWIWCGLVVSIGLWVFGIILYGLGAGGNTISKVMGIICAPVGALTRYYLSLYNKVHHFPWYTLLPNVIATVIGCIAIVFGSLVSINNTTGQQLLDIFIDGGLILGILGSLSTVSTWINELDALATKSMILSYRYGLTTLCISQFLAILIFEVWKLFGFSDVAPI